MWSLVMFDLPVLTPEQRREATQFRKSLISFGYSMVQFSVYAKYIPIGGRDRGTISQLKRALPPGGEVRMLHVSDHQWAKALRFRNRQVQSHAEAPEQLTIF